MSMSTHVVGFRPPDEKWKQMKAVYDSCMAAGVEVPLHVRGFFNHAAPSDTGVEIDLMNHYSPIATPWETVESVGCEIVLANLPEDITVIRFYNSW